MTQELSFKAKQHIAYTLFEKLPLSGLEKFYLLEKWKQEGFLTEIKIDEVLSKICFKGKVEASKYKALSPYIKQLDLNLKLITTFQFSDDISHIGIWGEIKKEYIDFGICSDSKIPSKAFFNANLRHPEHLKELSGKLDLKHTYIAGIEYLEQQDASFTSLKLSNIEHDFEFSLNQLASVFSYYSYAGLSKNLIDLLKENTPYFSHLVISYNKTGPIEIGLQMDKPSLELCLHLGSLNEAFEDFKLASFEGVMELDLPKSATIVLQAKGWQTNFDYAL